MTLATHTMKARTTLCCVLLLVTLVSGGCGRPSHREPPPDVDELKGKSQAWFQENWGSPGGKAKRFFGGETWVYFRLTGTSSLPFSTMTPTECQIRLDFDKEGTLEDSGYSGC